MEERDFDAIVVGSGCAGPIAALELARAGKSVLVVERGDAAGSKNMTGGRIYMHPLRKVFDADTLAAAPLERRIVREKIMLMAPDAEFTIDFSSDAMRTDNDSYSVLRGPFDQWLADQAEEAGAEYICGIPVEELVKDDAGAVIGIRAGEDEITANVVILCDGVNSLLTEQAVGYQRPPASAIAVGIKQTFALPAKTISDRCLVSSDGEGMAMLIAGDATKGNFGGGFMYTNRESVSLGIVAGIEAVSKSEYPIYQMMEELKSHPGIAALIEGGELVEHSGHMVPEGGLHIMPKLVGDGVLVAGESAMMCINFGYAVRGMDYAVAAGQMAGKAAVRALDAGDVSARGLSCYQDMLEDSFVMKDLRSFSAEPEFLEHFDHMFCGYPEMVRDIMNNMLVIDGSPAKHVKDSVMPEVKKMGYLNIFKDMKGALKAL
ncbi:FAD-dependent oxidoreductase [Eggerthellaceae bacterium zg-893]|nr:FAD-dependent oxidoreductase [Eggerthellaceae bacterium zg-893]